MSRFTAWPADREEMRRALLAAARTTDWCSCWPQEPTYPDFADLLATPSEHRCQVCRGPIRPKEVRMVNNGL